MTQFVSLDLKISTLNKYDCRIEFCANYIYVCFSVATAAAAAEGEGDKGGEKRSFLT